MTSAPAASATCSRTLSCASKWTSSASKPAAVAAATSSSSFRSVRFPVLPLDTISTRPGRVPSPRSADGETLSLPHTCDLKRWYSGFIYGTYVTSSVRGQ